MSNPYVKQDRKIVMLLEMVKQIVKSSYIINSNDCLRSVNAYLLFIKPKINLKEYKSIISDVSLKSGSIKPNEKQTLQSWKDIENVMQPISK